MFEGSAAARLARKEGWSMQSKRLVVAILVLGVSWVVACSGQNDPRKQAAFNEKTVTLEQALTSSAGLTLQVETVSCVANQVQPFFQVANGGTTSVKASDITIKLWVDDTTGQNVVGAINYGGCLVGSKGCFHPVTGVRASAVRFAPACGPDSTHQANWEVTISNTDATLVAPGVTWGNLQSAVHLPQYGNFSPGTGNWYSPCRSSNSFAFDTHYALYVAGNLVTASPGVPPSCRAATGTQVVAGEVPPGLGTTFPLVGPLPGATPVSLAIGLPLVNQASLQPFIDQVSDPTSPTYRQYLTPDQFAAAYGPSQSDYNALQTFATSAGLTVTGTYTSRDLLVVSGSAAAVENAFFVTLNVYKRPDNTTFFAPANNPSLNLTAPLLLHVSGFDSFAVPISTGNTSAEACGTTTGLGSGAAGFFGTDYRNTYASPCATTAPNQNEGAGQTIALFAPDSYAPADITSYANGAGGTLGPVMNTTAGTLATELGADVKNILVPGGTVTGFAAAPIFTPGLGEAEVEVGMEMALSMAPLARLLVYQENASTSFLPAAILAQMAEVPASGAGTTRPPQVIVNSWTWTSAVVDPSVAQVFQRYAVQGQSFFQASGDLGSYNVASSVLPNVPEPIIDSSLMTVVGGTQFKTTFSGTPPAGNETTWNDPADRAAPVCTIGTGQVVGTALQAAGTCNSVSGGGFCSASGPYSKLALPTYQAGVNPSNTDITGGPANTRMIPDVSILADNLATFTKGAIGCSHGTSAAAALWGGFAALVNNANTNFAGPVGFANPELYFLGSASLSDVADSSNNHYNTGGGAYTAFAGYDLATGLGSPLCSLLPSLPPQSCMPGTSAAAVVTGTNVTAYLPNGSYGELVTGIRVVPIEGTGSATTIGTPNPVNTCGGNSKTGDVVCTSNGTDVYIIKSGAIATTLTSGATGTETFSGGTCSTCNVAIDPLHNQAFLSVGTASGIAALQLLNLKIPALSPTLISLGQATSSEDIVVDTIRGLVLSPNEASQNGGTGAGDFQLVNATTGAVFDFTPTGAAPDFGFDQGAEDCTTGIAVAAVESDFGAQLFLADLTQATFSGTTWTAPSQFTPVITEFSGLTFGATTVSMAPGSHLGVVTGEFGGNQFGVIALPSASGTGTPSLVNWVAATIPNDPNGVVWQMGHDPHDLTAYTSPTTNKQYAIIDDDPNQDGTGRTFIAVIDLQGVVAAAGGTHTAGALTTCRGAGVNGTPAVPGCVVRFLP
jgi:hypothetical protein